MLSDPIKMTLIYCASYRETLGIGHVRLKLDFQQPKGDDLLG